MSNDSSSNGSAEASHATVSTDSPSSDADSDSARSIPGEMSDATAERSTPARSKLSVK
jgi:hypothetical protein